MPTKLSESVLAEIRQRVYLNAKYPDPNTAMELVYADRCALLDHITALEEELKAAQGLANVKNAMWNGAEDELDQIRECDKCDLCEDHYD